MEDPDRLPAANDLPDDIGDGYDDQDETSAIDSPEELQRRAEEAMEQMLIAREEEENDEENIFVENGGNGHEIVDGHVRNENRNREFIDEHHPNNFPFMDENNPLNNNGIFKGNRITYVKASFMAAFILVYYAFRSRQQWYLALVFLSSSKWAYIILGNALVALLIWMFQLFTAIFLNGLRLAEAEGLGDFFRWNITETCLALTIFRTELSVKTGVLFLMFVLAKCLHWVADMRESHLRMTEESVVVRPNFLWPALRLSHVKLLMCLYLLQMVDMLAVLRCGLDILQNGPSVSILFAFESAIMLTSVISNVLLWHLHLLDGLFHFLHETTDPTRIGHRWIHPWKDHKATLVFAVEVQAQAAKFCFYVTFFAIVMTYYGLPINLIREVYVSFQSLKQRLIAFQKYRQLMTSMNRFANPTAEELEGEHTCIICRDEMTVETAKRLPGCRHIMHKSCLREWLVQQQTCPTCRGDISAMEARQRQQDRANAQIEVQQEQSNNEDISERTDADQGEPIDSSDILSGDAVDKDGQTLERTHGVSDGNSPMIVSTTASKTHLSTAQLPDMTTDVDRKFSVSASLRGKRVRIVAPRVGVDSVSWQELFDSERPAFPAFYRVVQDRGASVYNDGQTVSFIIRVIPCSVVLIALEMDWRKCDGENRLMIRIPDGWVDDEDIERIVAVPFEF